MSELSITTTQNVNINFNTASVGERILAHLLDYVVKIAYFIAIAYLVFNLMGVEKFVNKLDMWEQMTIYLLFYLPVILYTLVQESLFEGQTIGKRIMKIKVIKIDGYQAGFGDYLMRWLLRLVDIVLSFNAIGLVTMLVNSKTQRLGDIVAGTAVITLKNDITINHTILKEISNDYIPIYPLVIKLTDNDIRIIKETYDASVKTADFEMINKLKVKVETVTGIKSTSANATAFIDTILHDYNYYTQKM